MSADSLGELKHDTFVPQLEPEDLAAYGVPPRVTELLGETYADKGVDPAAIDFLAEDNLIGQIIDRQVMGNHRLGEAAGRDGTARELTRYAVAAAARLEAVPATYEGTIHEHRILLGDYALFEDTLNPRAREFRKNGATRRFESGAINLEGKPGYEMFRKLPIAVIGAGAAGTLTARALREIGFDNVDLIDKRGKAGGIWQQANVADGSKNNPFPISFDDVKTSAARDVPVERSGQGITDYIEEVARTKSAYLYRPVDPLHVTKGIVRSIEPGDLEHRIEVDIDGKTEQRTYPIVIYAPGLGTPLPVKGTRMTSEATRKEAGIRWQQQLSDEKLRQLEGQRLVFVGLGNSTAEMVHQLQGYKRRTGREVDYRILTHFTAEMLQRPNDVYGDKGAVYRSIAKPELTKLAGDLQHIKEMFRTAHLTGKIVPDVHEWQVENGRMVVTTREGVTTHIDYDQLYTLIGYGHDQKTLQNVGITARDRYRGTAAVDYDGEVQKQPGEVGRERIHPGYFAIGPIVRHKYNPNAIVIPGIQHQINEMLTTVLLRGAEYSSRYPHKLIAAYEAYQERAPQLVVPIGETEEVPATAEPTAQAYRPDSDPAPKYARSINSILQRANEIAKELGNAPYTKQIKIPPYHKYTVRPSNLRFEVPERREQTGRPAEEDPGADQLHRVSELQHLYRLHKPPSTEPSEYQRDHLRLADLFYNREGSFSKDQPLTGDSLSRANELLYDRHFREETIRPQNRFNISNALLGRLITYNELPLNDAGTIKDSGLPEGLDEIPDGEAGISEEE